MSNNIIPEQIKSVIGSMLNKSEHVSLRYNYKLRLLSIKDAIDTAISSYDKEFGQQMGVKKEIRK